MWRPLGNCPVPLPLNPDLEIVVPTRNGSAACLLKSWRRRPVEYSVTAARLVHTIEKRQACGTRLRRQCGRMDGDYRGRKSRGDKGKGSPYSTAERRVPELIPVLGSQPASDVSHKPDGRLPLLSARPAVTPATLKRAATSFAAW